MDKIKRIAQKLLKIFLCLFVLLNIICAFHAYKLTHFYTIKTKMPTPEEMSFGDKSSAAIFGVKFPKSICIDTMPHSFFANEYVYTEDGLILSAWNGFYDNEHIGSKGTIILFHGHGSNKCSLIKEAEFFLNLSYNVTLVDFRAHGNSDGNTCTIGYNESKDVKAAYNYVKNRGEKNIVLYGISLGAASILKAIATDSIKPNKIILEMPFASLYKAVKGRLKIMHLPQQPFATLLTFWGGVEQGFWAFNMEPQEYAKAVQCPTLLQWGANDARVTREETKNIFDNLATKDKLFVEYKNSGHQSLCKNENEVWAKNIEAFLSK